MNRRRTTLLRVDRRVDETIVRKRGSTLITTRRRTRTVTSFDQEAKPATRERLQHAEPQSRELEAARIALVTVLQEPVRRLIQAAVRMHAYPATCARPSLRVLDGGRRS